MSQTNNTINNASGMEESKQDGEEDLHQGQRRHNASNQTTPSATDESSREYVTLRICIKSQSDNNKKSKRESSGGGSSRERKRRSSTVSSTSSD